MRWIKSPLRVKDRRLEISGGGRWFLLFTLFLGAVAVRSGNNVIYLLESLLLSALLFSGVLSELTLSRLSFRREVRPAVAGEPTRDILKLENLSWLPLYCVELGEWDGEAFRPLQFALAVPRGGSLRLPSGQVLSRRGRHEGQGLALATSFPFGFARKIRVFPGRGGRLVWPRAGEAASSLGARFGGDEWEVVSGELEETSPWGDLSRVHWPATLRAGKPLARPRRPQTEAGEVHLHLPAGAAEREARISTAARSFYEGARVLVVHEAGTAIRVEGNWPSLDTLALLAKGSG